MIENLSIAGLLEQAVEHHKQGRIDEAAALCRDALRQDAGNPLALHRLGLIARQKGQKDKALDLLLRASRLLPKSAEIHSDLGKALLSYRNFGPAIQRLEIALSIDPQRSENYLWLAGAYAEIGRSDKTLQTCDRAIKFAPDDPQIASRIAGAIMTQGRMADALEIWRKAVAAKPDPAAHSALLFSLHYVPDSSPREIFEEHCRFAEVYEAPLLAHRVLHENDRDPDRPLRIGYVSPDFKMHPVAQFLQPVLARHNPVQFQVFCYSATPTHDSRTLAFQKIAGTRWRDIRKLNSDQSCELIRRDKIDILIDTAGHTGGSQLMIFARKPAPVQVTSLGYPDTTGLHSIDYRITDANADPPGQTDRLHTEKLLRLPCFLCYESPDYTPEVASSPALKNGFITFGSFNNFMKVAPQTIETWAEILKAVPNAKLLLKHRGASDVAAQEVFPGFFEKSGIGRERIVITPQMPSHRMHLDSYREMDIALDPFPYNGTTTTCEALAMGVPVLALEGSTHVARVGVSLLRQVGLSDWIAKSKAEYVDMAIAHSRSPEKLEQVRSEVRRRMLCSELGSPVRFTDHLENSYRAIWRDWCG